MILIWGCVNGRPTATRTSGSYTWEEHSEDLLISEVFFDGVHSYIELSCTSCPKPLHHHYAIFVIKKAYN